MKQIGYLVYGVFVLIGLVCVFSVAKAEDRFVPSQYQTVQAAIDAASNGDVVIVADGTYTGAGNKNLDFKGKAITVKSGNGPQNCIIDCGNSGCGFSFHSGETSNSVVEGFTIRNGNATTGGAIFCSTHSNPTIRGCVITNNAAAGYGGGIYCYQSNPTLINCTITNNTAPNGSGIHCSYSSPTITNCIITNNTKVGSTNGNGGAGIGCISSNPTVTNCTIANNTTPHRGGGIYCAGANSHPTLNNTILWGNSATSGGHQIYATGSSAAVTLNYCDYSNGTGDVSGTVTTNNCITSNPLFVDAVNRNYRLQNASLCVDTGSNSLVPGGVTTDLDGNPRILDASKDGTATVDLGAYELLPQLNVTVASVHGEPNPPVGTTVYIYGSVVTVSCGTTPYPPDAAGTRYLCTGWTGGSGNIPVAGTNISYTFTITQDSAIMWTWKMQHLLRTNPDLWIDDSLSGGASANFILILIPSEGCIATATKGNVPLTVQFIDASAGDITSWSWNFGEGANPLTADTQGPHSVTYSTVGPKTVGLIVTGPDGSDTETKIDYLNVIASGTPLADFFGTPTSGVAAPLTVQFKDKSIGNITSWAWDFDNDGVVDSTDRNPSYTYNSSGRFTVKLTVTGPDGSDSETTTDCIRVCSSSNTSYCVSTLGDDGGPGDSKYPFRTIQRGLDVAGNDDAVLVAKGTYSGTGNVNLNFAGKAIHLQAVASDYGYDVGDTWTIDCENISGQRGFVFQSEEDAFSVVDGFTIINGKATTGGGIYCFDGASPTITNCIIMDNESTSLGGGIYCEYAANATITGCTVTSNLADYGGGIDCDESSLTITDCVISGNSASESAGGVEFYRSGSSMTNCIIRENNAGDTGGGICCWYYSPVITNCVVTNNIATNAGGGIECIYGSSPTIKNCLIANNSTTATTPPGYGNGGGIDCEYGSNATFTNCTIANNTASGNGGGICCSASSPVLSNSVLWGNIPDQIYGGATVRYCDVQGGWTGQGNIDDDPVFADSANANYRLIGKSPCVDTGNNGYAAGLTTDLDGNPRIQDGDLNGTATVDMGAYEASYLYLDSDGDGLLNIEEDFYHTNPRDPDTDHDGLTDFEELFGCRIINNVIVKLFGATNPFNADTDSDSHNDLWEVDHGYNPLDPRDGHDNVPPDVLSTAPSDDSTNVPTDSNIEIVFTEPVGFYHDSFRITAGGTDIAFDAYYPSYKGSCLKVILNPTDALPVNTTVTVTINYQAPITDFSGNYMIVQRGITFQTSAYSSSGFPQHEANYYVVPPCEITMDGGMKKRLVCEQCKLRYCTIPYTGECYWWEEDAAIENPGDNSVAVIRSHRNKRNAAGAFGYNWSCNLDQHFEPGPGGSLLWTSPCGRTFDFSGYTPPPGFPEDVWNYGNYIYRRQKDGTIWKYEYTTVPETKWRLVSKTDRNGNATSLSYNGGGYLSTVTDMCGRTVSFTWNTQAYGIPVITQVTDPYGNTWTYEYATGQEQQPDLRYGWRLGDLWKVTSPGSKETKYTYWTEDPTGNEWKGWEIKHNLRSVTDPEGHEFLTNYYDAYDRVIQQEYGYGIILNFYTFEEVTEQGIPKDVFITTQVDRNGNVRKFKHYSEYEPGWAKQPAGGSAPMGNPYILDRVETKIFCEGFDPDPTTTQYYTEDRPEPLPDYPRCALMRTKYPKGNGVIYERDYKGNITKETRRSYPTTPLTHDIEKHWTYDYWYAVVLSYEDEHNSGGTGQITNYYYDNCSDSNYSLGNGYFKTPNGTGGWIADPPSGSHGGNLVKVTYPQTKAPNPTNPKSYPTVYLTQNPVESYYYNAIGQRTGSFVPDGNGAPLRRISAWSYYSTTSGNPEERGKLHKSWTDYRAGGLMLCTEVTYYWNWYYLAIETTDPRGFTSITAQDVVYGRTLWTEDAKGYYISYGYDDNNNLSDTWVENKLPDGSSESPDPIHTTYEHDILNFVTWTTTYLGADDTIPIAAETEYDRKENATIARKPLGNYTETVYDERDMVKAVVRRPLDAIWQREDIFYEYDANGNLIKLWDSDGYADGGIATKQFKGRIFFEGSEPIIYEYDGFDRQTKVINEPRCRFTHSLPFGKEWLPRDETVTKYNPDGTVSETCAYSGSESSGVLMSRTVNTYDQLRRLVMTQNVFFKRESGIYFCLNTHTGQDCGHTDPLGDPSLCHCVTTVNIYNEDSQLVQVVYDRDGYNDLVCRTYFTYDGAGRRETVKDSLGETAQNDPSKGNKTAYYYDKNGNLIMTEEREMKSDGTLAGTYYSHSFYDELNRLIATVNNMGNTRYFYYDSRGNLRIFRDANGADAGSLSESDLDPYGEHEYEFSLHDPDINLPGHRTEYGYDALGRRTWTRQYYDPVDPDNYYETMLVWDENSRLEKQVDDNGNETQYFYDNKDRRWRIRYASSTEINPVETIIIYHSSDVVYQIIDPNLGTITHEFDSLGRVINREARPGPGSTVGRYDEYGTTFEFFEYDALGRVIFAEDNDTQTEMTYDSLGNLYSETQTIGKWRGGNWEDLEDPVTEEVHSGYDGSGNRLWGPNAGYVIDCLNRVTQINCGGTTLAEYSYTGPGYRYHTKALGNEADLSIVYDAARRPTSWDHMKGTARVCGYTYAYDREGNKWFERKINSNGTAGPADVYNYDGTYRLTDVKYSVTSGIGNWNNLHEIPFSSLSGTRTVNYGMDGVGNRLTVTENTVPTSYTPNEVNEYESVGNDQYFYDRNGNLLWWDASMQMFYNYANRLVQIVLDDGVKYCYRYDALGRRVAIDSYSGDALTSTTYFFYDGQQIVWEERPETSYEYVYGIEIDEPIVRYEGDTPIYYHANSLGSVVALTDEDGELLETVEYDVYGASAVTQHNGASPTGNRFLFTGREQDAETGLYHYRARAYSPYLGRFLQRDRISYDTFLSLYAYVENDPINRVDPVGLHWFREEEEARLKKETEEAWERAVVESKISPWATWEGFRTTEIWDNFNFPKDIMAVANQNLNAARAWVDSNLYDPFRDPFFRQEVIQKLLNPTMEQYWNNLQQEFGAAIGADVEKGQNMYVLKLSNVSKGTAVPLNTPSAEVTIKGIQQGMLWVGNVHTHPGTGGPSNFDINGAIDKKRPDWVVDCDRTVWVVSSSGVVREYYHKLVPPALTSLVY